jgi:seryl-tRNA synthetase
LHRAVEEADRLKRSLKAASKRRTELTKERRKAAAKAEQARAKAAAAEAKYDKEVLAELVRREKEKDRAAPPGKELQPAPERSPAIPAHRVPARSDAETAETATPAPTTRRSAPADPPPEQPDEGTQTSQRTAARKTAKAARLIR